MSRVRLLLVAALVLTGLTATPASAAEPPECHVHSLFGTELTLRDSKPFDFHLDCGSSAADFTVSVGDPAQHGTVNAASWNPEFEEHLLTYDPVEAYVGPDEFTLLVSDGAESTPVSVHVDVVSNSAPSCERPEVRYSHTRVADPRTETIACVDVDPQDEQLVPELAVAPGHGRVEFSMGWAPQGPTLSVTYVPEPGFTGSDRFVAGLSDGDLADHVEFRFNVADGPWCDPFQPTEIRAGMTGKIGAICSQPDDAPDPLQLRVVGGPAQGTATVMPWLVVQYTPVATATGTDSFSYEAYSSVGVSNVVSQEWIILPNAAPVCEGISTTTGRDDSAAVPLTCTDADGDPVTVAIAAEPQQGSLGDIVDGQVIYTPDAGFVGTDRFTYTGTDYALTSAPAAVQIIVDDGKAPVLGLSITRGQTPRQVARRGLAYYSDNDEQVTGTLGATISGRTAKRLGLVRRASGPVRIAVDRSRYEYDTAVLGLLHLTHRAAEAIRPARRVTITVRFRGVDPMGDVTRVSRRVTLRR